MTSKNVRIFKVVVYFINLLVALSFGLAVYAFYRAGKPFIRGFYCDDKSIAKPYKDSTIPSLHASLVIAAIALVCFILGEMIELNDTSRLTCKRGRYCASRWSMNVMFLVLLALFGAGITMFITDIGKYSVGRLRPHFISVCNPKWSLINCTDNIGRANYIVGDHFCTNNDASALKAARLSFPSGHSSFSAFSATFLILYVDYRLKCGKWSSMPKFLFQVVLGSAAFYIGLSRISDYKHHPTDVVVGFIIGIFVGVVLHPLVRKYCRNVVTRSVSPEQVGNRHHESTTEQMEL